MQIKISLLFSSGVFKAILRLQVEHLLAVALCVIHLAGSIGMPFSSVSRGELIMF